MHRELIERLEKAEGPSNMLDFMIFKALGWGDHDEYWTRGDERYEKCRPPYYTSSIDAALTLVPDMTEFKLEREVDYGGHYNYAWVEGAERQKHEHLVIALVIATLKARMQRESED
jgi:hypothetical protein